MWFRKPERDLKTRGEGYLRGPLGATDIAGSLALPSTPSPVGNAPTAKFQADEPRDAQPNASPTPTDLRARDQESSQLGPLRRGPARGLVIAADAPTETNSAYNVLRTQIIKRLHEKQWKTVAITSPSRGAGNTLTTINLGLSIARDFNHTVVLVELDLVNPSFRDVLGLRQTLGVVDHLLHDTPIPEIMVNPGIERLIVIPAGTPVTNASELISSPKMARFVEQLKLADEHRIILFDLPSVLSTDDAMAFSPLADCALLIVEEGETRINDVRRALDYLRSTRILGVVLNRSIHVESDGKIISR